MTNIFQVNSAVVPFHSSKFEIVVGEGCSGCGGSGGVGGEQAPAPIITEKSSLRARRKVPGSVSSVCVCTVFKHFKVQR